MNIFLKKQKLNNCINYTCYSNYKKSILFFKTTINNSNNYTTLRIKDITLKNNEFFVAYCYEYDTDMSIDDESRCL